jgi:hypothetical protein
LQKKKKKRVHVATWLRKTKKGKEGERRRMWGCEFCA